MAKQDQITWELKTAELDRVLGRFLREQVPEVRDKATRKIAVDIVRNVMVGLNGVDGLPKRIDTGRLRGAWRIAARKADLPTESLPSNRGTSGAADGRNKASDGSAAVTKSGNNTAILVSNNVEYARYVEEGTATMLPGNHLLRALAMARRNVPNDDSEGSLIDEIVEAFESAR